MTILTTIEIRAAILYLMLLACMIHKIQNAQIYPLQSPSTQITYTAYPNQNYGNGVGNAFNGYGNVFNGNQNSINGNINNLNGNNNQVNGSGNQVSGNNNLISGTGNIVTSGTGGISGFSGFPNKNITASFSGLIAPPTISIPTSLSSINIPTINSNIGPISGSNSSTNNTGQNLLNNIQSNSIGFSLPNPPNISPTINNNQQSSSQQYSQPPVINQNLGYSNSYNQIPSANILSNFQSTYSNQQIPTFSPYTQPQSPLYSFPTTSNQRYQIVTSQSIPGTSYMISSPTYSYPFMGTGSNFGSIYQTSPTSNSYNPYQPPSQNYNLYLNNPTVPYSPYNYYPPVTNPYVTNNPTLSSIYQQLPSIYQPVQTSSYSQINTQNYPSNNINTGNGVYSYQGNSQTISSSSPASTPTTGYYNSQFQQSNDLSGMQILQNFMLKLNSNGMGTNQ